MRKNYKITLMAATLALSIMVLSGIAGPQIAQSISKGDKDGYNAGGSSDSTINIADLTDSGYKLVWFDEFETTGTEEGMNGLFSDKWCIDKPRMSGDGKLLTISNAAWAIKANGGNLNLNAISLVQNGWYDPTATPGSSFASHKYAAPFTVSTEGKMSFKYGYLEIRAKVPYKEGCWPSFWLRSHNATDKRENPEFEVELDVFEVFGSVNSLSSNLHQQVYNGDDKLSFMTKTSAINKEEVHTFVDFENLSNEYHTYGVEWTPEKIAIYVDGVKQCEWLINKYALLSYGLKPEVSGFDTTMNILFNNHVLTQYSEFKPSDDNVIENYESNLPSQYSIDYVRLYQKNDGVSKLITGR